MKTEKEIERMKNLAVRAKGIVMKLHELDADSSWQYESADFCCGFEYALRWILDGIEPDFLSQIENMELSLTERYHD